MQLYFYEGSRRARLLAGLVIAGRYIRAGFVFNGANIPLLVVPLVWLSRWHYKIRRGACIHDWYWSQAAVSGVKDDAGRLYATGNDLLRQVMKEDGCNAYQRFVVYWAVTLSGKWRLAKKRRRK